MNIKFFKDSFYKVLGFNSISIVLKIIMGLVSTKLSSIYLGLQGINTLENFRNFTSISDSFSQFGLQNGIVKYSATSHSIKQDQKVISTIFFLLLVTSFIFIFLIILNINYVKFYIFGNQSFGFLVIAYALLSPFANLQFLLLNYLQGKQGHKFVILINSIGYVLNIILSFYLIINYHLIGAMIQLIVVPIILMIISLFIIHKKVVFFNLISIHYVNFSVIKGLLVFSLMNLVSGALTPLSFIFIRYLVQSNLSADEAGVWSSIVRISVFYMTFVSSICNLYFYPKLSKTEIFSEYKAIIAEYYRKFIPIVFLGLLLCFVLQKVVILIIYTEDFLILRDYFYLQLIADFVKSLSLIFGYLLIAKKKIWQFILFEIISLGSYCLGSYIFIEYLKLDGVYYSLIGSLMIYFTVTYLAYRYNK
jgi:O-antigen/teichoic acid export membrane protein